MRYLKRFNETKEEEIKEESDNLLSYFLDSSLSDILVKKTLEDSIINYNIYISVADGQLKWVDCKADICQYLEYIDKKYRILTITDINYDRSVTHRRYDIRFTGGDNDEENTFSLQELDNIPDDLEFWEIFFKVSA